MKTIYLDAVELSGRGVGGVFADTSAEITLAGTTIYSMDINLKKEYEEYANNYDVEFIFHDSIPNTEFYTVPYIDIMAIDSMGGFIGTIGQQCSIENDAPICYISKELECFLIAENLLSFLKNIKSWKENMILYDKVKFYHSKTEAEKELEFMDIPILDPKSNTIDKE